MDSKKPVSRTNSICPAPEDILLDCVKSNRREKIRNIIKENLNLLTYEYSYPDFGRILYIACSEHSVSATTIKLLLELGANPCDETEDQGEAIHVAARLVRSDVIEVLANYLDARQLNHTFRGNNALLILVKEGDYTKKSELLECAKTLIKYGINVNHADLKNLTAVLWAIKKDYKELVEVLLNNSSELDIDSYTLNGKTARELILSKYSSELTLPNKFTHKTSPSDILFSYLRAYNEDAFVSYNNVDISEYKNVSNGTYTLLQLSCQLGLLKAVTHLIENKADLRKTTDKQQHSPLELASENGFHSIIELLLENDPTLKVSSGTLSTLLNRINLNDDNDNYHQCFILLLKNQDDKTLNTQNAMSQTPLHLAVKFAKPEIVLELLSKGSSLANKNQFDIMPIEYIDAEVLEDYLNECVEINDIDKNNVYVKLSYKSLMPFNSTSVREKDDCEEGTVESSQSYAPETDAILYMCKAPHLRHLLIHPVIVTFLLLKWHKVHKLFLLNLIIYFIFLCSLLAYIFTSYGNFSYIPLNDSSLSSIASLSYVVLCITFFLLVIRELFQVLVNPFNYYKDIDNWIEVMLIFVVGFILFTEDPVNDTRKQLASIAILLSSFELVLMMGQHPRLTTYVVMFKRVSSNFVKFLAWYFLLIAAFALSFYILFSDSTEDAEDQTRKNVSESVENKEDDNNFFVNPGVSLFKTLVMLTGEFDASDMNFHSFPITSKVIFILFVLMIALILLNLLNGLAVSDTQTIKNDAECVGLIARTEHINYIESMVFGNILPTNVLNMIQKLCCCFPSYDDFNVILGQPLSKYTSLYPMTEITIPMSNDFETAKIDKKGSKRNNALSVLSSFYLDKEIKRKVKKVIQLQKQKTQNSDVFMRNKMRKLESDQKSIIAILKDIQLRMSKIENSLKVDEK